MYNEKVLDHFQNPRNLADMPDADLNGMGANPVCGDVMKLFLKTADGKVTKASFKTMGCGAAIAAGSVLTEHLKGMTLEDAARLTPADVVQLLGTLPAIKMHCPDLAIEALKSALSSANPAQTTARL